MLLSGAELVARYGLPAIVLCLPLEFTSQLVRLQLARIVLLVVALAFLLLVAAGRRAAVAPMSLSIAVLVAYVAASLISWAVTRAPGSTNPLLDIAAYPVMALLIVNLVRTRAEVRNAWFALLVSGLLFAIIGAFLYLTHLSIWRPDLSGLYRVNGTFGDPNIAARFLTLVVCAAILMFAARERRSWVVVATVVAGAAIVPLTFSKSGYLVFPVATLLVVPFVLDRRRGAAVAALALLVFAASIAVNPATRDRSLLSLGLINGASQNGGSPITATTPPDSLGGGRVDWVRSYLLEAGWQMFLDHPVTGVGFGAYQHSLMTAYRRFLPANPPATLSHTSAITIAAEQGLVGLALFLGFLGALAWEVISSLRRRSEWRNWIVMPALLLVPILVYSQVEGRLTEEPYLWLALGLLFAARRLEGSTRTIHLTR